MTFPNRRDLLGLLALAALPLCPMAQPAAYPSKPVELVVPYPAGGGTDVLGRAFAVAAVKHLPQPLIVMNKPGAAGAIGWADVLNGKEPGYKVALLATDLMTQPNMGLTRITYQDFTPIARLNYDPAAITVRADAPWKTVEEFIAAAKKADFRIGNGGNGSTWHLAAAALEDKTGAHFNHIPFAGANPAALTLLGGHIEAITVSAAEVYSHVAAGKLRVLAVMSEERIKGFENVPTLKERGLDIQIGTWRGLAVPKGTPPDVVATLRAMTAKTMQEPSLREALEKQNMGYAYADGEGFGAVMARDHAYYGALIKKLGLKGQ
ncbi:tripartite tricarboxylate transporter substrate binding protein [Ramlibacter monticola]|uniref:Tripartite tricarboxylate transporter substrate binding protein n=1 Tax=Ramlibacter monticola TaxID=1926872 RepID=A0A937CS03_9BURK|nr:tripartite tricarboxylate transporter substrate binding protein [Ramlibacter monticola]MBL0389567.1 tripartite tricarboxylate transporter substrate binding protein [Ramlibacter monticola]